MKLHCEICALYDHQTGTARTGPHSEIATIIDETMTLPLKASHFDGVNPERGTPPPWRDGAKWDTMKCPRGNHNIFVMDDVRAIQAMNDGGPKRILTDSGWLEINPQPQGVPAEEPPQGDQRVLEMIALKESGKTNAAVGRVFSISASRVSQLINKYKRKLKRG